MEALQELITLIRRLRKEYGVPEGAEVGVVLAGAPDHFQGTLESEGAALRMLARVGEIDLGGSLAGPGAHGVLVNGTELFLPLEGVIDLDREKERLRGEIQRLEGQHHGTVKKLENRSFVEKAPAEVVEREREKAASFREQLEKLQEKLRAFEGA
jgi:valyl-tRNA synthetase